MNKLEIGILLMAASASCFAQQWEVGGTGGAAFLPGVKIASPLGAATTGFQTGIAAGAFVSQNLYPHISGEIHYGFLQSNLKLQSGGTQVTFAGMSHVVHYDLILHTNKKDSRSQYFVAFGGGMRIFTGTGKEAAYQPLSQFAYLTRTQELKPLASVGAGIKYKLSPRVVLRTEFRDYITPFPKTVIAPAPNSKIGSILHTFVPMVGISSSVLIHEFSSGCRPRVTPAAFFYGRRPADLTQGIRECR